jgi:hypothetical protein
MAESVTNELMYEPLKNIQKDIADMRFELRTQGEDAVKGPMASMMHSIGTLVPFHGHPRDRSGPSSRSHRAHRAPT